MTKILALDTSSEACSVALYLDAEVRESFELVPRQHTQRVLPMIESLLSEAGLELTDLDAIGFGAGPGSFTGLRITAGVAQGLALGAELPLLPISTLAALAEEARLDCAAEYVLVALDARMGELYWGAYQVREGRLFALVDEQVSAPENIQLPEGVLHSGANWLGVGPGWNFQDQFPLAVQQAVSTIEPDRQPRAAAMARLAALDFEAGKAVAAEAALPVYLRNEITWKKSNHRD